MKSAVVLCLIAFAALLLSTVAGTPARAATSVQTAEDAYDKAVVQLLILERRVADARTDVAEGETRLERLKLEAGESSVLAETAAADLEAARSRYSERIVETYKAGGTGWLELLLGSDDLSQFIGRTLMLGRILGQDAEFAGEVARARLQADEAARQAREAADAQEEQLAQLSATRDGLEGAKKEQAALVKTLGGRLEAAKAAAAEAARKMAEVNARTQKSASSAPVRSATTVTTRRPATTPTVPGQGRQLTVKSWAYALKGTTATGIPVARGVVAVDPRVIPLGTRLFVPGYGEAIAADTGRDIKGNIIDVWMPSLQEARAWGTRIVTITIYD